MDVGGVRGDIMGRDFDAGFDCEDHALSELNVSVCVDG